MCYFFFIDKTNNTTAQTINIIFAIEHHIGSGIMCLDRNIGKNKHIYADINRIMCSDFFIL